jgi:hypothetical protein
MYWYELADSYTQIENNKKNEGHKLVTVLHCVTHFAAQFIDKVINGSTITAVDN